MLSKLFVTLTWVATTAFLVGNCVTLNDMDMWHVQSAYPPSVPWGFVYGYCCSIWFGAIHIDDRRRYISAANFGGAIFLCLLGAGITGLSFLSSDATAQQKIHTQEFGVILVYIATLVGVVMSGISLWLLATPNEPRFL